MTFPLAQPLIDNMKKVEEAKTEEEKQRLTQEYLDSITPVEEDV